LRISGRWFYTREQTLTASKRSPPRLRGSAGKEQAPPSWQAAMTKDWLGNPIGRGQRLMGPFSNFRLFNGGAKIREKYPTIVRARRDFGLPWLRCLDRAIDIGLEFPRYLAS
jgi:hypothetical protein